MGTAKRMMIGAFCCWLSGGLPLLACKYSVRDVGFVGLQSAPYRLCVFSNGPDPRSGELADVLAGTNIELELVDIQGQPAHPAMAFRQGPAVDAVLLAPDGRCRQIQFGIDPAAAVRRLVESPLRTRLLTDIGRYYCTILLLAGTDAGAADRLEIELNTLVQQVAADLPSLPKAVPAGARLLRLSLSEQHSEAVALWAMGVEDRPVDAARVVILMGRLRRFGGVYTVPETDMAKLRTIVGYIGQDCECSLDRRWMEGMMLPHRWDTMCQIAATKALGFDPDSPMVQTEVSQILAKPRSGEGTADSGAGYSETVIDLAGGQLLQATIEPTGATAAEGIADNQSAGEIPMAEPKRNSTVVAFYSAIFGVVAGFVIGAVMLFWKGRGAS